MGFEVGRGAVLYVLYEALVSEGSAWEEWMTNC